MITTEKEWVSAQARKEFYDLRTARGHCSPTDNSDMTQQQLTRQEHIDA